MKVQVRYFASVRELLGSGEEVELKPGADIAGLRAALAGRGGPHADALAPQRAIRAARNRLLCSEGTVLSEGDEVGFFPPVTGG